MDRQAWWAVQATVHRAAESDDRATNTVRVYRGTYGGLR